MDEFRIVSPMRTAEEVRKTHELNNVPIDIEDLCSRLNIPVFYADFTEIEDMVKKDVAGVIRHLRGTEQRPESTTILVNDQDAKVRQRFTIAHELGHYFLHMKERDTDEPIISFRSDNSPREREANSFAAALLVPEDLLREEYGKMVIPVSDALADIFRVSKAAMRIRLEELELLYV